MGRRRMLAKLSQHNEEVLFMCHTVYAVKSDVGSFEQVDYGAIAAMASKELGYPWLNDESLVNKYFKIRAREGVQTLADLLHINRLNSDTTYRNMPQVMQHHEDKERVCLPADGIISAIPREEICHNACKWSEAISPHVSINTLKSVELQNEFARVGIELSDSEVLTCVNDVLYKKPGLAGSKKPNYSKRKVASSQLAKYEINHARNMLELVTFGDEEEEWDQQRDLLVSDLSSVIRYATFQTVASEECYKFIGERFWHTSRDPVSGARNLEKERFYYIRVIADVLKELGRWEMERVRKFSSKDYKNFIIRNTEMRELRRRFGDQFQRFCNAAVIRDEKHDLDFKQSMVEIFYGLWNNARKGENSVSQSVKSLIKRLTKKMPVRGEQQQGVITMQDWKYGLKLYMRDLQICEGHLNTVIGHYPSLSDA